MDLYEEYRKHNPELPVHANVGDTVYRSGGTFDDTKAVKVVENYNDVYLQNGDSINNYESFAIVNTHWNKIFFDSYEKAEKHSRACRMEYWEHAVEMACR